MYKSPSINYPDDVADMFRLRFRCDCGNLVGRDFYDPTHEKDNCYCSSCGSWVTWRDDYPKQKEGAQKMQDKEGNKYDYKPNSCGYVIYKNNEFYMQVSDEEDAKEIINELCEER